MVHCLQSPCCSLIYRFWGDSVNHSELVSVIAGATKLPVSSVDEVLELLLQNVIDRLNNNDVVKVKKFGEFRVQKRPTRTVRNPKTGVTFKKPGDKIIKFYPANYCKDSINV
jgi:DNA-binding protein HU-beta